MYRGQFFYDTRDNKVHVAVPDDAIPVVTTELEEFQLKTCFEYQLEKLVVSRCHRACGTNLPPGSQLLSVGGESFMFSGTVIDEKTGITVAHAVNKGEDVMRMRFQNGEEVRQIVGRCLDAFRDVQRITERSEFTMTADMAVLALEPHFYVRRNLVEWAKREFRIKIYRGARIRKNTEVMVLDQTGRFRQGSIQRQPFTDTTLEARGMKNLYNVLGIGTGAGAGMQESAITRPGDSGALVLSLPSERSGDFEYDVLYVYGIVIGSWDSDSPGPKNSLTIANSLSEVIPEVFVGENVVNLVHSIPVDGIDFTEMADYDPNDQ